MTELYLLEPDPPGAAWAPFAGVRPVAGLRAGLWPIRERWERALGLRAKAVVGAHCEGFAEGDEPPCVGAPPAARPAIVAASWFAPAARRIEVARDIRRLVHDGATVGWVLREGEPFDPTARPEPAAPVAGVLLRGAWGLLDALERLLADDCASFSLAGRGAAPPDAVVLGDPSLVVSLGASVEPGVVFDVRHGPVVLDAEAEVRSGTRLEGPVYVGPRTRILGGFIRESVFGPECRARGEIASSVFLGYANKAHEGFVGHSVLGCWVNLGAGTTTSNLKNTYGPVRLEVGGERIETGRLNVGTLFGDHAKTAIGTLLATGTVIGAGANVFGAPPVPKYVAPFAWGASGERMSEEGFLRIAERVMPRRAVEVTPARREALRRLYARALDARAADARAAGR